jgi:Fe-S-cluster-containing dehydrogenase component/formate-dependent nitrite reductase membrane component NrfD
VEKGLFPNVRRYFTVLRCNHCADAPCVNICPTRALFHRSDGIVDFDSAQCIACKSCMAACPYDAIYIDPESETAAKCNYCAHKIEVGLEPACVTVCPEQAIVAGDLDNPGTRISTLVSVNQVQVRKPEKGTRPKVFYIDGDSTSLTPGAAPRESTYVWAERPLREATADFPVVPQEGTARTTYDIAHKRPWGALVSFYLWTKSLASGPILVASLLLLLGYARAPELFGRIAPALSLIFTALTVFLLIADLDRPERFLKVLLHPNWRSWLVWGSYILIGFSAVSFLWLLSGLAGADLLVGLFLWPGLIAATLAAGYSGFLLAQARARDLWQSRLLFPHLVVQAFVAGSALLASAGIYVESSRPLVDLLLRCLLGGLCVHGTLILSEVALPYGSRDGVGAVHYMLMGPLARLFWFGAVFGGTAIPIYLLSFHFTGTIPSYTVAAAGVVLSMFGLLAYDDCYIRAGQALPLS